MVQPQAVLNILLKYEQEISLVNRKYIYHTVGESLDEGVLTLVIFSCLATKRGKEELVTDFFKTLFFDGGSKGISNAAKKAIRIVQEIEALQVEVNVLPILVDTEPRRTWGWNIPQDDLTLECEIMCEQASNSELLPGNWKPIVWSELESRYVGTGTFEKLLEWAKGDGRHSICVREQTRHLSGFADRYSFPLGLEETALRQVAGYAFEGIVLQDVLPNAILLQSEFPAKEKDPLYQWLRAKDKLLPIIHPFPN